MDDDEPTRAILESSRFWVHKVFVPILLCIGLAGNIISVMVLTRRRMRSSTNTYLSALAIADIVHLIFNFLLSFKHYAHIHDKKYELYWRFYGLTHWLCDAASATSTWLAVSFTVERYIAVCHPMKGKVFCTERKAKSVIVIVYILCALTTASTTFEYALTSNDECLEFCKAPLQPVSRSLIGKNATNQITYHTIEPPAGVRNFDEYLRNQLKDILANCTNHPHVIYVSLFPNSQNNFSARNFIENQLASSSLLRESSVKTPPKKPKAIAARLAKDTAGTAAAAIEDPKPTAVPAAFKDANTTLVTLLKDPNATASTTVPLSKDLNATAAEDAGDKNETSGGNMTCCVKNFTIDVELTDLGKNETYMEFIYWYSALFFGIIPLALIATFNCFLVRAVYVSQKMRRVMTNSQDNISFTNEKRITIMLIGIVFIFLICNAPTSCWLLYYNNPPQTSRGVNIMLILANFFNLLMMLNAPFNFLIYCLLSKKFRSTFMKIFWERRKQQQQVETETFLLSATKSTNKFNPYKHGLMKRNASEYHTPRNLETQSLTSIPRSRSLMVRPVGQARSSDINV